MKKIVVLFALVFFSQVSFANDKDKSLFAKAKELIKKEHFSDAIPMLELYAKDLEEKELKEVYLELANAYYGMNYKTDALKNIKFAITKAGMTEQDFIYSETLSEEVSSFAWKYFYDNFDELRKQYLNK